MTSNEFVTHDLSAYELLTRWGKVGGPNLVQHARRGRRGTLGLGHYPTSDRERRARRRSPRGGPSCRDPFGPRDANGLMSIWSANAPPPTASA
jgi:hypothetical protein